MFKKELDSFRVCEELLQLNNKKTNIQFFFLWPSHAACLTLAPPPGIESVPPVVEAQSLNHCITREVPRQFPVKECSSLPLPRAQVSVPGWRPKILQAA